MLHNLCFSFLLGITVVPRKNKGDGFVKFWGQPREGVLWEMCKWWIPLSPRFSEWHWNTLDTVLTTKYLELAVSKLPLSYIFTFLFEASDPTKPTKRKKTDDFETSADGKLIIRDDESENELQEPGAKRKRKPGDGWWIDWLIDWLIETKAQITSERGQEYPIIQTQLRLYCLILQGNSYFLNHHRKSKVFQIMGNFEYSRFQKNDDSTANF